MASCSRLENEIYQAAKLSANTCSLKDRREVRLLAEKGERIVMNEIPGFRDLFNSLIGKIKSLGKQKQKQKMDGGKRKTKKKAGQRRKTRKQRGGLNKTGRRIFAHIMALSVFCIFFAMIYFSFDKLKAVYAYFVEKFDPYISKTYLKAYTPCSQEEYSQPMQSFMTTGSIAGAACGALGLGAMYFSGGTLAKVVSPLVTACTAFSSGVGMQAKMSTEIQNMCDQRLRNYTLLMNGIISVLISGGLFTVVAYFKSKVNNGTLTISQFVRHIYNYIFNAIYYNEHSYNLLDLITKRSLYGTLPREEIQELRNLHEAAKQREDDQKTILQINKIIDIVNSESRGALVTMGEQKVRLRRRITKLHFDATAEQIQEKILQLPEEYRDDWRQMNETQPSHAEAIGIIGNAVANGASGILQMGVEQQKLRQQQFHQLFDKVGQVITSLNTPLQQIRSTVLKERESKVEQRALEKWLAEDTSRRARDFDFRDWSLNNRVQTLREEIAREEASKAAAAAAAAAAIAPVAAAPAAPAGLPAELPALINSEGKKTQGGGRRRRSRKRRKRSRKQKRSKTRSRSRKRRRRSRKR